MAGVFRKVALRLRGVHTTCCWGRVASSESDSLSCPAGGVAPVACALGSGGLGQGTFYCIQALVLLFLGYSSVACCWFLAAVRLSIALLP